MLVFALIMVLNYLCFKIKTQYGKGIIYFLLAITLSFTVKYVFNKKKWCICLYILYADHINEKEKGIPHIVYLSC